MGKFLWKKKMLGNFMNRAMYQKEQAFEVRPEGQYQLHYLTNIN